MNQDWDFWLQHWPDVTLRLGEHGALLLLSLTAALAIGLPLAVGLRRLPWVAGPVVTGASVVQTIPVLALLGVLLPLLGVGKLTVVTALFLYSLLPILLNTIAGLAAVDARVVESARALGLTSRQLFWQVELPLALPTIIAGVRAAAVINIGVAMLGALIGAGGLGALVFRGIATNQATVVLLGAVPAALLAMVVDGGLAWLQRSGRSSLRRATWAAGGLVTACLLMMAGTAWPRHSIEQLRLGVTTGFQSRADGFQLWSEFYRLPSFAVRELEPSLLYEALRQGEVDLAFGHATDGRISAFGLRVLTDDKNFFPSYQAAPVVRGDLLARAPAVARALSGLAGAINDDTMRALNDRVDTGEETPRSAATKFLTGWAQARGVAWNAEAAAAKSSAIGPADVVIGAQNFTEQYVMGQILVQLINGSTSLRAQLRSGLTSSSICFQALERGEIDLYIAYSGTLLLNVLQANPESVRASSHDQTALNTLVNTALASHPKVRWMEPLGFNRTYVLLIRADDPRLRRVTTHSELGAWLEKGAPSP